MASRAKSIEQMKIKTRKNTPDGVLMYSLYGEKRDKIVLVRQYRVSIDDYIYEFRQAWWNRARSSMRLPCARA